MRILFTTIPGKSHYWAMVPLAWACRAAGYEVIVACTPSLAGTVTASGLPVAEIRGGRAGRAAGGRVGGRVSFARRWQRYLGVHDEMTLAGPVAAAVMEVPCVSHHRGGPGPHRVETPGTEALFERFGVAPAAPGLWIDLCPPSMRLPTDLPRTLMGYVPYDDSGPVPAIETARRPRICVTWGETPDGGLFRTAIDAVTALDAEPVVVTSPDQRDALGQLPPEARVLTSTSLHTVVPDCDAVVHHGGSRTLMTCAWAGVPQVVIARGAEPVAAGAGLHLRHDEIANDPTPAKIIQDAAERLLAEPGYLAAAERLSREIAAQPTPADTVRVLEELVRG